MIMCEICSIYATKKIENKVHMYKRLGSKLHQAIINGQDRSHK